MMEWMFFTLLALVNLVCSIFNIYAEHYLVLIITIPATLMTGMTAYGLYRKQ